MTFDEIAPELNPGQKKLLLRELLGKLPEKERPKTHKFFTPDPIEAYIDGYNQAIDNITTALTEWIEG